MDSIIGNPVADKRGELCGLLHVLNISQPRTIRMTRTQTRTNSTTPGTIREACLKSGRIHRQTIQIPHTTTALGTTNPSPASISCPVVIASHRTSSSPLTLEQSKTDTP